MSEALVECPECKGVGDRGGFAIDSNGSFYSRVSCSLCRGGGAVAPHRVKWWTVGRAHYRARVAKMEGIRECAARLGVTPQQLSAMEHGRADPAILGEPT
jgi:hypothetical protein